MSLSNGSISASRSSGGYSASVRLYLRQNGEQFALAQVGDQRLYFDRAVSLSAGAAEIVVEIDGVPKSSSVLMAEQPEPARIVAYSAI